MLEPEINNRQVKGEWIAKERKITETPKGYIVPSQSGNGSYLVYEENGRELCTCPDYETRGCKCKHQWAVEYFLHRETDSEGNTTTTEGVRVTYTQDWTAYNTAQTNEIKLFDNLLMDLVKNVDDTLQVMGRPRLPIGETLFCAIQKVYSTLSQRRASGLFRTAEERDQIDHAPHFNAVGKLLNRESITPILTELLSITASPLQAIETVFIPDSSGFTSSKFNGYAVEKYKLKSQHKWLKAHILAGAKTHVVVSAVITDGTTNDCPMFEPLVLNAHEHGFNIKEIPADKGYVSRENYQLAEDIGATAYIPFKKNATPKSKGYAIWKKMYYYFQLNRDDFMEHYHQRSNVESTFNMVKAKFGDKVKSKNHTAQINELLCKLIAHNIVVLIHAMYEFKIDINLFAPKVNALHLN